MNVIRRVSQWIKPGAKPSALGQIVVPQARDRWMASALRHHTPDTVEATIRGAFSGDLEAVWGLYDLMEATWPRLMKNLKELRDAVVSADWTVQPWTQRGDEPSPEATQRAEVLDAAIWAMRGNPVRDEGDFRGLCFDLLDAWGKGISVVEILWAVKEQRGIGRVTQPTGSVHLAPRYYGYPPDGHDLQLRTSQIKGWTGNGSIYAPFPPDKFLVAVAKQKSGHPVGGALLRPLAWWWCAANFSQSWLLNFAQVFGLPIRWAQYDPNTPGLLDQVCEMLENMGSAAWGAFPTGTTIELKEPVKGSSGSLPQEAVLDRADLQCDLLILGQTLTTDVGDSGSRALGDVHEKVLSGRKAAAADWLAGVLNSQLSPAFTRLNWGDEEYCPQFVVGNEAESDPMQLAQRDEILSRLGIQFPREWFYLRHSVPIPGNSEDVLGAAQEPVGEPDTGVGIERGDDSNDAAVVKCARCAAMPVSVLAKMGQPMDPEQAVAGIVRRAVADAAGVRQRWLAPVQEHLDRLIEAVQSEGITDAQVALFLDAAARDLPQLFERLDQDALAGSLEQAMAEAVRAARQ